MGIKCILALFALVVLTAGNLFAGTPAPTTFNTYDGDAPGARAVAMGGAFCAVADDATAMYYNPAGLLEVADNLVSATYEVSRQSSLTPDQIYSGEALKNRSFQFLAFVTQKGAVSFRPVSNYTSHIQNGQDWENDQVQVSAYTLSAAHKGDDKISTGLNLTYLSGLIAQSKITGGTPYISNSAGYGFCMDFGFLYKANKALRLGLNLKNLAGYMWWDDFDKDQLPFIAKAGIDYQIKNFMNISTEVEKRYYRKADEQTITSFGIEQWVGKILSVRAGMSGTDLNDAEQTSLSAGIGYTQGAVDISITLKKYRVNLTDVNLILMSLNVPI